MLLGCCWVRGEVVSGDLVVRLLRRDSGVQGIHHRRRVPLEPRWGLGLRQGLAFSPCSVHRGCWAEEMALDMQDMLWEAAPVRSPDRLPILPRVVCAR